MYFWKMSVLRTSTIFILFTLHVFLFPILNAAAGGVRKSHGENEAKKVPIEHVEGVMGHRIEMPCDITPRRRDDTVYMVLWFRETTGKPLYSFDVRGRGMKTAKTWSEKKGFDRRADFQPASHPAFLLVNDLRLTDQAVYRCRVDFRNSPTRNSLVNLTVVVPPSLPVIYDGSGAEILSTVGPYIEGSDVLLTCRVSGGKPDPVVSWYVNGELEDSSYHMDRYGDVINDLLFRGLKRSHLNSQFSCRANNTKLIQPVEKTLVLELNLKPLFVRMRHQQTEKTVAGQVYRVVCETAGSKPPASLRWFKGGNEITQVSTQELDDGNVTTSTFVFIPTPGDNGASIICRAENPWLNRSHILEEIWNLNVVYSPEVKLSLGSTLNPMEIKEGTDVYFECKIQANPKASKLIWFFNSDELKHNVGAGIIMSNQSLVLQGINRKATGNYTCIASNAEGSTHSNAVFLSVMYSPVCLVESGVTVGTSKGESVALRCAVEANPTAFRFEWEFHGAGDNVDVVPDGKTVSQGDLSRFFYTPNADSEFGTFLCWASNDIGRQVQPCVFHVVAAVKPHILENCTVVNQTTTMIHVECNSIRELPTIPEQPLFRIMNEDLETSHQDPTLYGLFPEYYVMEVWDLKNRSIRRNLSAETPNFMLKGLLPGSWLRLILYAVNSHGKSDAVVIETVVAGDAEKQTLGASRSQMDLFPLVALGVGTACIGTLIVFILALILRSRLCTSPGRRRIPHPTSNNSHSIVEKTGSVMPPPSPMTNNSTLVSSTGYRTLATSKHEADAANPDIIPGANNFSTMADAKDDPPQSTLPRRNLHMIKDNNHIGAHPQQQQQQQQHQQHHDPLGKILTMEYQQPNHFPSSYGSPHHEPAHPPSAVHHPQYAQQPNNVALFSPNNYQHANKTDYNTIYIREKLLHDSDIPESCV